MSIFYGSDDYISIKMGNASFYYGYEVTLPYKNQTDEDYEEEGGEWCFEAIIDDTVIILPSSILNAEMFDVTASLLSGIEAVFEQYKIVKR